MIPQGFNVPRSSVGMLDNMSACSAVSALGPPEELRRGLRSNPPLDSMSSGFHIIGPNRIVDRPHFTRGTYSSSGHSNFQGMVLQGATPLDGWDNVGKIGPARPRGLKVFGDQVCGGPSHAMATVLEQVPLESVGDTKRSGVGPLRSDSQQIAQVFSGMSFENVPSRQRILQTEDSRRMAAVLQGGPLENLERGLFMAVDESIRNVNDIALASENYVFGSHQAASAIHGVPLTPDIRTPRYMANQASDLAANTFAGGPLPEEIFRRACGPQTESDLVRNILQGSPLIDNGVRRRDQFPNENSHQMFQVFQQSGIVHNRIAGSVTGRHAATGPLQAAGSMLASPRPGMLTLEVESTSLPIDRSRWPH